MTHMSNQLILEILACEADCACGGITSSIGTMCHYKHLELDNFLHRPSRFTTILCMLDLANNIKCWNVTFHNYALKIIKDKYE